MTDSKDMPEVIIPDGFTEVETASLEKLLQMGGEQLPKSPRTFLVFGHFMYIKPDGEITEL